MHIQAESLSWRSIAIILVYGGTLLSVNLGGAGRALTFHEVLFAQPAREMLAGGDWVVPRILGAPDTHKPPLTSWLLALALHFLGESEWAVRVPSVLAALLTAVWLGFLSARWFGDRLGCVTGLIQLTMYYVLQFGRLAESDIFLVLFVLLAMGVFLIANVDGPHGRRAERWLPWTFYVACGLTFMTKGLIGLAFVGMGCVIFAVWQCERSVWRFLFNPPGLIMFAACLLAWPLAAYAAYPPFLDDQIQHHLGRFHGRLGEDEPIHSYLYSIPRCALPWTPLALWGMVIAWRRGWARGPLGRFTLCWIAPGVVLLTASQWRHYHYVAPLMPPAALFAAVGLMDALERLRQASQRVRWGAFSLACIVLAIPACVIVMLPQLRGREPILGLLGLIGIGCGMFTWRGRSLRTQLATLFSLVWLLSAGAFAWVIPHYDRYSQQVEFARRINAATPGDSPITMVELAENQLTWYLRQPLLRVDDATALEQAERAQRQAHYLVAPQAALDALAVTGNLEIIERSPVAPRRMESLRACFVRWRRWDTVNAAAARSLGVADP